MAVARIVAALLVFVAVLESSVTGADCPTYPPCAAVPVNQPYYYPNWDDCSTYWECNNRQAFVRSCPTGQTFDFYTLTCKTRPTLENLSTNPVFSCEILLNGVASLNSNTQG